jgi:uncharacterized protein (TIGR02996 family)
MTEQEAFLQAIVEEPDDDTPRLVYADWLDENGQHDRAEFIRVQCLQASLPWDDDRQSELLAREARLLARHYEEWTAAGGDWPDREDGTPGLGFRRGFIERVLSVEPAHFLSRAPALFAACPVRDVLVELLPGTFADLAGCPYPAGLRTLRLFSFPPEEVYEICRSPRLARLEALHVYSSLRSDGEFRYLLGILEQQQTSAPGSLRSLGLADNGLSEGALAALIASPLARTVTSLDLSYNFQFTVEGLRHFVSSPWWRRLEELNVGRSFPDIPGAGRLLAEGLGRTRLRALRVDSPLAGLEDSESLVRALSAAPTWGPLRALSLGHCGLDGGRLRMLLDCPHTAGLTKLDLLDCRLGDDEVEHLAGCPRLCGLTALGLGYNSIGDRGAVALAESPYQKRLRRLHLQHTRITDAGIAALVRSANVEHLRLLSLGPGCSESGVAEIARSPRLDHLYALHVRDRLTDDAALALAWSPFLRCLAHLFIDTSRLSETGQQALCQATHGVWGSRGALERHELFFSWEA